MKIAKKTTLIFVIVLISSWLIYPFVLEIIFLDNNTKGLFGDSYGALNSLFSGLALVGIIYTILQQQDQLKMQREELMLQRKELELTRHELKRTAIAQEKSEAALSIQANQMIMSSKISALSAMINSYNSLRTAQ